MNHAGARQIFGSLIALHPLFNCSDIMAAADEPPDTTRIELKAVLTFCF
jgi:hypothetical protein